MAIDANRSRRPGCASRIAENASLDRDASDRSFDRQPAHLGLLDDAAPLFREGASVPGVGVLLALPCLVESGLFRISRKLYGEIGPAFYGLRTTLLTLLLMALLRIKRPEHLKERDPAAFGRLLGLLAFPEGIGLGAWKLDDRRLRGTDAAYVTDRSAKAASPERSTRSIALAH
jgi:hypothetical protein